MGLKNLFLEICEFEKLCRKILKKLKKRMVLNKCCLQYRTWRLQYTELRIDYNQAELQHTNRIFFVEYISETRKKVLTYYHLRKFTEALEIKCQRTE